MHCPDCSTVLIQVQLSSVDQAYRCFKCGGFWIDSWAVNRITNQSLAKWRRISSPTRSFKHGSNKCPLDGLALNRYIGESVPGHLVVKKCDRCGKWWFGGDSLFEFKPAQETKIKYMSQWGLPVDIKNVLLPVAAIVVLGLGVWIGLELARTQQRVIIDAFEKLIK